MVEIYDKVIFLNKKEEFNDTPEGVKKMRDMLLSKNISKSLWKIQQEFEAKQMEKLDDNSILLLRKRAEDYELMFLEQREITQEYRNLSDTYMNTIEELRKEIKTLKIKK